MTNKCSYTVLTGCAGDSTESLLKQHSSAPNDVESIDTEIATPSRGKLLIYSYSPKVQSSWTPMPF